MSKKIIVYTSPSCIQCQFTKNFFHDRQIAYELRDIQVKEEYRQEVLNYGFQAVPVVVVESHEPFCGFRPDLLEIIAKEVGAE